MAEVECKAKSDFRVRGSKSVGSRLDYLEDKVLFQAVLASGCVGYAVKDDLIIRDVAPATPENPRNTEGSVVELKDGTLLLAWSRFYGGTDDANGAEIAGITSGDGGRTWSEPFVIQENVGEQNVMSVSLLRLQSGRIGLCYGVKNSNTDLHFYLRYTDDETATWSEPKRITDADGYNIINNDRLVQLSSGRLIAPVAFSPNIYTSFSQVSFVLYSDDEGLTWRRSNPDLTAPLWGAMEPGVAELADERLMMIIRTQVGVIYESYSDDGGETWSEAVPGKVISPEAPATLKRIPGTGDLLLIWNNNPDAVNNYRARRTPLTAAISRDNGATWENIKNVEGDPGVAYTYVSVAFVADRALLTYYCSEEWDKGLSLRFKSIPLDWFYSP